MRCSKARRQIGLKLDNELSQSRVQSLELHLKECSACREFMAQEQKLQQMLRHEQQAEFPSWLHHQILSQAAEHDRKRLHIMHRRKLQLIPVTLAVVLCLTLGSLIGKAVYGTVIPYPADKVSTVASQQESPNMVSFGESSIFEEVSDNGVTNE